MTKNTWINFYLPSIYLSMQKVTLIDFEVYIWIYICMPKIMLIHQYLQYGWFKNYAIWLTKSIFDYTQLKIFKSPLILLKIYLSMQKITLIGPVSLKI